MGGGSGPNLDGTTSAGRTMVGAPTCAAKESTIFVITSGVKLSIGEKSPAPRLGAISCFCVKENSSFAAPSKRLAALKVSRANVTGERPRQGRSADGEYLTCKTARGGECDLSGRGWAAFKVASDTLQAFRGIASMKHSTIRRA